MATDVLNPAQQEALERIRKAQPIREQQLIDAGVAAVALSELRDLGLVVATPAGLYLADYLRRLGVDDELAIALVAKLRHRTGPRADCKCVECLALKRVVVLAREAVAMKAARKKG